MEASRLLIVGAGGHGRVMLDVIRCQGGVEVVGFLDDDPKLHGQEVAGVTVLGSSSDRALIADTAAGYFLPAIGNNHLRAQQFVSLQEFGLGPWPAVHPSSVLAPSAVLGRGVQVVAGVVVNPDAEIGDNVILNTSCTVDHDCRIEEHAFIGPGAHLGGNVAVGRLCLLGIGVCVLPGLQIGEGTTVGAGAVITKDMPAGAMVYGVPARVVRE